MCPSGGVNEDYVPPKMLYLTLKLWIFRWINQNVYPGSQFNAEFNFLFKKYKFAYLFFIDIFAVFKKFAPCINVLCFFCNFYQMFILQTRTVFCLEIIQPIRKPYFSRFHFLLPRNLWTGGSDVCEAGWWVFSVCLFVD